MTSGKRARQQRLQDRRTPTPAGRRASPKVLLAGAAAVVGAIAVVVGAVALTGGEGSAETPSAETGSAGAAKLSGSAEVTRLYRGIPQSGVTLGRPAAPVTLVEYVDLQCPFCRQFVTGAFPTLVEKYVRPGKVRVELRGLAFIGPDSVRGMRAAQAAAAQNRMFQFVDLLYINQGAENGGWLSDAMVRAAGASVPGLDVEKLVADAGTSAVAEKLDADKAKAQADGVTGTPTILVGPTGEKPTQVALQSMSDLVSIEQAIAAAGG